MTNSPPPWLTIAMGYVGFHERGNNLGIEHFIELAHTGELGDPWCAIFVNACLEEAGLPGSRSAAARSFERNKNFRRLDKPIYGCIVTRWRVSPESGKGHVYFYLGEDDKGIKALAGNENDQVQEYHEGHDPITGYWWPVNYPLSGTVALPKVGTITAPPSRARFFVTGRIATFGGPDDSGMSEDEGIAIFETVDELRKHNALDLVLPGTFGRVLGHDLNPDKNYVACRWDYKQTPRSFLQDAVVVCEANGRRELARAADWGPNERTGRVADFSPGLARRLGVDTDDIATVSISDQKERPMPTPDEEEVTVMPPKAQPPAIPAQIDYAKLAELATKFAQAMDALAAMKAQPAALPPPPPPPPAPTSNNTGVGLGIIGLVSSLIAAQAGVIGTPLGDASTTTGVALPLISIATTALGAFGKLQPILRALMAIV